jgi:hypothetical protein
MRGVNEKQFISCTAILILITQRLSRTSSSERADGVRRLFSVAVAAYDAADQYRQLTKVSPNDLIA